MHFCSVNHVCECFLVADRSVTDYTGEEVKCLFWSTPQRDSKQTQRVHTQHSTQSFPTKRSPNIVFCAVSFTRKSPIAEQTGRASLLKLQDWHTKRQESRGDEHAGSLLNRMVYSVTRKVNSVGRDLARKGVVPRMLRDRTQPFIRHHWLCNHTTALQPVITAHHNTHWAHCT